jgi:hypothetical protein
VGSEDNVSSSLFSEEIDDLALVECDIDYGGGLEVAAPPMADGMADSRDGDPPPLPPLPPLAAVELLPLWPPPVVAPPLVGVARVMVDLPDGVGKLAFYSYASGRQEFYAICRKESHNCDGQKCRRVRSSAASAIRPYQGRPLGFLTCWLRNADLFESSEEHRDGNAWCPDVHEREEARLWLHGVPEAAVLFMHERPLRIGEREESEDFV